MDRWTPPESGPLLSHLANSFSLRRKTKHGAGGVGREGGGAFDQTECQHCHMPPPRAHVRARRPLRAAQSVPTGSPPSGDVLLSLGWGWGVNCNLWKNAPPHWHRVHVDRRCFTLAAPGGLGRRPSDSPLGVLSSSCTDSSPKTKVFHVVFAAEKKQLLKDKDGEQEAAIKKRKSLFFCLPKR